MEFRSYSLTGAKQNFGIHYLQDKGIPFPLNFNAQFQEARKDPIAKASNFLQSITKLGQPEMPFPFACVPYDSEKKFVNHKKEFSTYRENNFIKEPIVNKTMNDSQYCPSKGNGGMCSTMSSHIVGGFVGSKSQVNIGTKKSKACDLGTFIFNVLNKWGRSEERVPKTKNMENSTNTNIQQGSSPQFKCTEGSSHKMDVDRNVNFGNIINLSNKSMDQHCDKVNGLNNACLRVKIPSEPSEKRNERQSNKMIKDCLDGLDREKSEEMEKVCQPLCSTPVPKVENPVSDSSGSSSVDRSKSVSFQICGSPTEKIFVCKSEEPQSPECSWKSKICSALGSRFRQQSECSVDSTDSESFIVFDDRCCESIGDEDEEIEEMDDEDDTIVMDDDYDCCSVVEANAKWSAWYCDDDNGSGSDEVNRKVKFNDKINVHIMIAWDYAYRAARLGPWEQMARDRVRFRDRILRLEMTLSPIFEEKHREKIYKSLYS